MKTSLSFILMIMGLFSLSAFSETITEQSFNGQWCGKWDNIYSLCITISSIDSGANAKYQWLEHPNGKFKKSQKAIKRINRNTLKIDNIWFALDEKNLNQANAMGIFQYQSRLAILKKE